MEAKIVRGEISVQEVISSVSSPEMGGIVVFIGTVRNHSNKLNEIETMEMEAYEEMAQDELERILAEAEEKFSTTVAAYHRIGEMKVGDIIVCIASASPHRDNAFASTRYIIDEIKKRLPLWKKESGKDGINWVNHP